MIAAIDARKSADQNIARCEVLIGEGLCPPGRITVRKCIVPDSISSNYHVDWSALDKLGGTSWERVKAKTKESLLAMAHELLKVYDKPEDDEDSPLDHVTDAVLVLHQHEQAREEIANRRSETGNVDEKCVVALRGRQWDELSSSAARTFSAWAILPDTLAHTPSFSSAARVRRSA